jgi:hypothetical protein
MTVPAGQVASPAALLARPSPATDAVSGAQGDHQGLIDTPLLLRAYPAHEFTKPSRVDGAGQLNQNTGSLTEHLDLRPERGRPGAARRWRNQHHRAREELVGLNDHAKAPALLPVTGPTRQAEVVDVTPQHEGSMARLWHDWASTGTPQDRRNRAGAF